MNRALLKKKIYGQLKSTFNAHPEFINKGISLTDVCASATKRIFGDIKNIVPEDSSENEEEGVTSD